MITFDIAKEEDIEELIRLRIAYMKDDFGSVSEEEKAGMESQLPDYFKRKLGTELIAFTARDGQFNSPERTIRRCAQCIYRAGVSRQGTLYPAYEESGRVRKRKRSGTNRP